MPVDMSRYPKDWKAISQRIRDRAGNCCESCGAPHGELIVRDHPIDQHRWRIATMSDLENDDDDAPKVVKIVNTVHHIGAPYPDGTPGDRHDKMDCRDDNLTLLCQKHHLLADLDIHIANAAATRRRRRVEAGQLEMEIAT